MSKLPNEHDMEDIRSDVDEHASECRCGGGPEAVIVINEDELWFGVRCGTCRRYTGDHFETWGRALAVWNGDLKAWHDGAKDE